MMNQAGQAVCQFCLTRIGSDRETEVCADCGAQHHRECWLELGGCSTYGCPQMVSVVKAENVPVTFWGQEEKVCPICAETIPVAELQCPHCKTDFDCVEPLTREDVLKKAPDPRSNQLRTQAIWLLVFSLLGCTSPATLLIGAVWYRRNRTRLGRADAPTRAMGQIAVAVSALYVALLGIGILIFHLTGAPQT